MAPPFLLLLTVVALPESKGRHNQIDIAASSVNLLYAKQNQNLVWIVLLAPGSCNLKLLCHVKYYVKTLL